MTNLTRKDFWANLAIIVGLLAAGFAAGFFFRKWQYQPEKALPVADYQSKIDSALQAADIARAAIEPEFRDRIKYVIKEKIVYLKNQTENEIQNLEKLDPDGRVAYLRSWVNDSIRARKQLSPVRE